MTLNQISRALYRAAHVTRNVRAVERSIQTGSVKPLGNRMLRIAAGRVFGKAMRRSGL
jgi:hypothetical protein